jgi:hypothetical protein
MMIKNDDDDDDDDDGYGVVAYLARKLLVWKHHGVALQCKRDFGNFLSFRCRLDANCCGTANVHTQGRQPGARSSMHLPRMLREHTVLRHFSGLFSFVTCLKGSLYRKLCML